MQRPGSSVARLAIAVGIAALILLTGLVDLVTGTEIRILALYFVPLLWAGWEFEIPGAVGAATFATAVWLGVQYISGTGFAARYVWVINGLTEGAGFVTVSVLVAYLRRSLKRERLLSRSDPLTGLQNRRALLESASRALAVCRRHGHAASVICLDLDNFKTANDVHGHAFGDQLLIESARILLDVTRESDVVARLGGDEFAIFLPETGTEQAAALLTRIVDRFDDAHELHEAGVSASVGMVTEEIASSDLTEFMRRADQAMYEKKRRRAALAKRSTAIAPMPAHEPQRHDRASD